MVFRESSVQVDCKNYLVKVTSQSVYSSFRIHYLVSMYYEENLVTFLHPPHNSIKLH